MKSTKKSNNQSSIKWKKTSYATAKRNSRRIQTAQHRSLTAKKRHWWTTGCDPGVQKFINDVERDVKKWKFKTEPRLDRIQVILDVLKIDSNEKKK